jgi:hypothetical protein
MNKEQEAEVLGNLISQVSGAVKSVEIKSQADAMTVASLIDSLAVLHALKRNVEDGGSVPPHKHND